MKNVLTLGAIVLLCNFSIQAQDCSIDAGMDSRTCSFQDTLYGIPAGGTWSLLCADSIAPISMNPQSDGSVIVRYSECGTYTFEYLISNDSCMVMDTVAVDFENPSYSIFNVTSELTLLYQNVECPSNDSLSCENTFEVVGDPPMPIWSCGPSGTCSSLMYSTTLGDSIGSCLVDNIEVNTVSNSDTIPSNIFQQYTQNQMLTLDSNNNVVTESFFNIADGSISMGVGMLLDSCPAPILCHILPPECLDTLLDTVMLQIPIHLGGNWTIFEDGNFVLLDSNNVFTIDSVDYWLNVTPSITDYNATFSVLEITPDDDTIFITNPIDFTFLWEEKWTTDTIQKIYEIIEVRDSCCRGGIFVTPSPPDHEMPPEPEYECSPFSITFFPKLLASSPTIICEDSTYSVQVTVNGGIPPYTTNAPTGTIDSNVCTVISIPQDSVYFSFDVMDSGGCEATVEGDNCICLTGSDIGVFDLETYRDCGFEGEEDFGRLEINHISGGTPPFLYSLDNVAFQTDTVFTGLHTGSYTLFIKDSFTCVTTLEFPIGNFLWNIQEDLIEVEICANEEIELPLELDSNLLEYYQVVWADGDSSLFKTINRPGNFYVTIYEPLSCTQFRKTFEVKDISFLLNRDLKIPNAFTPNGDGMNDDFLPYFKNENIDFSFYNLKVFSRWGAPVFQTNDPAEEWLPEGKFTSDVYVWFLEMEIVTCDGEKVFYKKTGDLTLIR